MSSKCIYAPLANAKKNSRRNNASCAKKEENCGTEGGTPPYVHIFLRQSCGQDGLVGNRRILQYISFYPIHSENTSTLRAKVPIQLEKTFSPSSPTPFSPNPLSLSLMVPEFMSSAAATPSLSVLPPPPLLPWSSRSFLLPRIQYHHRDALRF